MKLKGFDWIVSAHFSIFAYSILKSSSKIDHQKFNSQKSIIKNQNPPYLHPMNFPVVFYDGDCGFCNRSVQFILDHERNPEIHFCALQSEKAKAFFETNRFPQPDLSTLYFWNGKQLYQRSTGALRITGYLKAPYSWLKVFLVVPRFIRDGVYNWVAKRRHRFAAGQCALPTPEQRKRFI